VVNLTQDVLAGQAALIVFVVEREEHFGCQHDFVSPGEIAQGTPGHFFVDSCRIRVGGVEKVDPQFKGALGE
jgi:hypothetical protein